MGKVIKMDCPKCSHESTRTDEKTWKCLSCGCYFFYDPAMNEKKWWDGIEWEFVVIIVFLGTLVFLMPLLASREEEKTKRVSMELELERLKYSNQVMQVEEGQ